MGEEWHGKEGDRTAGSEFPEAAWRDAHPEVERMGKFTSADVVRWEDHDAPNRPSVMGSTLSTILGKARSLPEDEEVLRNWDEKARWLYRAEWGRDMDEVARIGGLLERGALEDAEVERLYAEVIPALRRALPTMRRMGYAEPRLPLGPAAPGGEERRTRRETEEGG